MEEVRGPGRGSYIFGRSVHNIRIERLWVNVTQGFGRHWKEFLRYLETSFGLHPDLDAHLWLLHYLFLEDINQDAHSWMKAWNNHVISHHYEPHRSPMFKYNHGMMHCGKRGIFLGDDDSEGFPALLLNDDPEFDEEEVHSYGVDWDDLDNNQIRSHHQAENVDDPDDNANPFLENHPSTFSHIPVAIPGCPFTQEELDELEDYLSTLPFRTTQTMSARAQLWTEALIKANSILQS
ncbi:hypothetical protein BDZ89DRAFT_963853 [Hymenopellis radicata]|nr:hypothetical protein BDZ89DRAFT_963853 [Hymenopellis radicata]